MKKHIDMTVGSPFKIILLFTLPLVCNYVLQQLYALADSMIVALTLNKEAVTGINLTGSLSFLVLGFANGCSAGFGTLLAQYVGAKDEEKMRKSFFTSICLTAVIALILTVIAVPSARSVLILLQTNKQYLDYSTAYIQAIFTGIIFTMLYNLASQVLLAMGDSKSPLIILIVSAILNLCLNCLLFVTDWTVAWAGWATVIAQGVAAMVGFIVLLKKFPVLKPQREDMKITAGFAGKHLAMGIPMAFQFSITAIGCMLQQRAFNLFPPEVAMGQSTGSKINAVADTGILAAFGATMATYCGQNYGAKRYDRLRKGVVAGFAVGGILVGVSIVGVFIFTPFISKLLLPNATEEVYGYVQTYTRINSSFFPFLLLVYFFRNALQGIGKSVVASFAGIIEMIARTICAFTLAKISFPLASLSNPCAWITAGVFVMVTYLYYLKRTSKSTKEELFK